MRIPVSTRFTCCINKVYSELEGSPFGTLCAVYLAAEEAMKGWWRQLQCTHTWWPGRKKARPVRLQRRETGPVVRNHRKMVFNGCQEVMCPLFEKRLVDSHLVGCSRNLSTGRKAVWSSTQRPILNGTVSTIHPPRW